MKLSISLLSVGLKKGDIRSVFMKIRKMLIWKGNIKLGSVSNLRELAVEIIWMETRLLLTNRLLGILVDMLFILKKMLNLSISFWCCSIWTYYNDCAG